MYSKITPAVCVGNCPSGTLYSSNNIATICSVVLTLPIMETATFVRAPISAIHSRKAEITISRPIIIAAGTANSGLEIVISALREWMAEIGARTKVAVSIVGKVKTTLQMVAILLLLYKVPLGQFPTHTAGVILLYIAATLTLWSMFVYLKAAWPILSGAEEHSSQDGA